MAQLRRFYTRVVDENNAAVTSPTVKVLRVGAEVVRDASSGNLSIGVRHPGALKYLDQCYVIRNGAVLANTTLDMVDTAWTYSSGNGDFESEFIQTVGSGYTPTAGDRLVLTGNSAGHLVDVYDNDSAGGSSGVISVDANGVLSGYVDALDVDVLVTQSGADTYITDLTTESRDLQVETVAAATTTVVRPDTELAIITGNSVSIEKITGCRGGRVLQIIMPSAPTNTLSVAAAVEQNGILVATSPTALQCYTLVGYDNGSYSAWSVGGA